MIRFFNPLLLILFFSTTVFGQDCSGPYLGKRLTREDVQNLSEQNQKNFCGALLNGVDLSQLNLHQANFSQASLKHAHLNGTDLSGASLNQADLSYAELERTYFRSANLQEADLSSALLTDTQFQNANLASANLSRSQWANVQFNEANLYKANLSLVTGYEADFSEANLRGTDFRLSHLRACKFNYANAQRADFSEATLNQSDFSYARLQKALFIKTNLTQSHFVQTILTDANFQQADLLEVEYKPDLRGMPLVEPLASSVHFSSLVFYDPTLGAPAMRNLQLAYKTLGMRPMERLITSMAKEQQMKAQFEAGGWQWVEGAFNYVFFYLTVDFGQAPGRPLVLFLVILLFLSIPYYWSLGTRSPYSSILVRWTSRKEPNFIFEASYQHFVRIHSQDAWIERAIKHYRRFMTASYFSLLSAVRIGWQDFNLALWISFMQTRDYELHPRGWVRSLSGFQSVMSAYLVVLWALCYFGHPFEW